MPKSKLIGRFAPSATGKLHLGSLTTALASHCHIKSLGGEWLIRIEDVDFERCKNEYSTAILRDLEQLGLHSDQAVIYQSQRTDIYEYYIEYLDKLSYHCDCSRKSLSQTAAQATAFYDTSIISNLAPIYPRNCLGKSLKTNKLRLCLPNTTTAFFDHIQGIVWDNPAKSLGDVVIKRQNGMINYILAAVVDDGLQHITHIMRGLDIMPMTVAQLFIAKTCRLDFAEHFYHLPLLINPQGQKLSKQTLATPIDTSTTDKVSDLLYDALTLLGQAPPSDLQKYPPSTILAWGIAHWNNRPLVGKSVLSK